MPDSFTTHITDLCQQAYDLASAGAMPGAAPSAWQIPSTYPSGIAIYDPEGFIIACDRTDQNQIAAAAYATGGEPNSGRIGTVVSAKMKIDHIAGFERSLQARHAPPVRLKAWAAGRRAGHASLPYGIFGSFSAAANDAAAAATVLPNSE